MVRPSSEGPGRPLPTTLGGGTSTPGGGGSADNEDWEDGAGPPGGIPGTGTRSWELWNEGGQSLIDDDSFPAAGATEDFDPTDGNEFTRTLDDDLTVTILAPTGDGGAILAFWFTQDGSGGHTVTIAADTGSVTGDISGHTTTAGETFRVMAHRIPGTTNDWVVDLVGGDAGEPTADAHIADTADAHDASAISIADAGALFDATDVEAALAEVAADVAALAASPTGHAHVVSETHLSNGSAVTYTLDQTIEPGTVIAWNVTSLARLAVVEAQPDQATVSAAGSSGDAIVFDYATPIV